MKVDEARKIADSQLEKLSEALRQGKSETLNNYLAAMSKLYRYSFRNLLLIYSQRPDATYVAGFNSWKKLGRWVKKGEKGIVIISPIRLAKKDSEQEGADETQTAFKASYVFDVSQTEGEDVAEFATVKGDPGAYTDSLKQLIQNCSFTLEYSKDLGSALGLSKGKTIIIEEGLAPAVEFSVLVHEVAHALLHQNGDRGEKTKTVVETEAEAVAFVVSSAIGLDTNTAASDYIQLYNGDHETLKESLDAIHKASSIILTAVYPDE